MVCALAFALAGAFFTGEGEQDVLRVVFPLKFLKPQAGMITPSRIDTIYEYDLLENLAVGLVRDDVADVSGYRGGLAESWEQRDARTWVFRLRENLRWSDGTRISPLQITDHFERLRVANAKHLVHLKNLASAEHDPATRNLILRFREPTDRNVLHECSLADAALTHPENLQGRWHITSGPYTVRAYEPGAALELAANPHCPLLDARSPQKILLAEAVDWSTAETLFSEARADFYYLPPTYFVEKFASLVAGAPAAKEGAAVNTFYFLFNGENDLAGSTEARREFATLVREAYADLDLGGRMRSELQMIPEGYAGRLAEYEPTDAPVRELRGKTVVLNVHSSLRELDGRLARLVETARERGVNLQIRETVWTSEDRSLADEFARFHVFKGNQKDALGSFSYLFSEGGELGQFHDEAGPFFQRITISASPDERARLLMELHRRVLDDAFAVPFAVQRSLILLSPRVSADRLNPFDMRQRYYELRWH